MRYDGGTHEVLCLQFLVLVSGTSSSKGEGGNRVAAHRTHIILYLSTMGLYSEIILFDTMVFGNM